MCMRVCVNANCIVRSPFCSTVESTSVYTNRKERVRQREGREDCCRQVRRRELIAKGGVREVRDERRKGRNFK